MNGLIQFINFDKLKTKDRKEYIRNNYIHQMIASLTELNRYEDLPNTVPYWALEQILISNGIVGIGHFDKENAVLDTTPDDSGRWMVIDYDYKSAGEPLEDPDGVYACIGSYSGYPDPYNIGRDFVGAMPGHSMHGEVGKDIVVGWNNATRSPDMPTLTIYADLLTEINISMRSLVILSRATKTPIAESNTQKEAFKATLKKILEGDIDVPVSESLAGIQQLAGGHLEFLDITRVEDTRWLSDLALFRDEVMKDLWIRYGIDIMTRDKKAQITTPELDAYAQYGAMEIHKRLKWRQKMLDDCNELFGWSASVRPAPEIFELDDIKNKVRGGADDGEEESGNIGGDEGIEGNEGNEGDEGNEGNSQE